jgi:hypothetical protein
MHRFVKPATHVSFVLALAAAAVVSGCDKKADSGSTGASSSASASAAAKPAAPSAAPAANLPVKGPWEAIKISMTKKDPDGTTHFKIDNLGSKTVSQIYIDMYGYDAKGKQVAHKDRGFSRSIKGGASDEYSQDAVKDVDTWEATYHGIAFDGEKDQLDDKRAPAQRAKGAP